MNEVFLCLGGNLGDRLNNINKAKSLIASSCGSIVNQSGVYETEAWGSKSKLKYLNQVIEIKTTLKPNVLLKKLLSIEQKLGRVRTKNKNNDRTMDIDILFYGNEIISEANFEVPHPRLHLRNFVLKPLFEIAPAFKHPVLKKSVKNLLKICTDKLKANAYKPVRYICIEGNIGSGKTTLATELSKQLKAKFLPEQFEKNDLLPLFYSDSKRFAFPLEYSFLLNRYQQITDSFKNEPMLVIADYSIYKCLWFGKVNLSKKDYSFFKKHFSAIQQQLPSPDLIVFLNTSVSNLKTNIKKRGRKYEQSIPTEYLDNVSSQYLKGFEKLQTKKLVIDIDNYHPGLNASLIKTIKKELA